MLQFVGADGTYVTLDMVFAPTSSKNKQRPVAGALR